MSERLCSVQIPHWSDKAVDEIPVIAGKIQHAWSESHFIEHEIGHELAKFICHPMRIAVIREENGPADTVTITPMNPDFNGEVIQ